MPLPILTSLGAGAGNAARELTSSIGKGIGNVKSVASSGLSKVGNFKKGSSAEGIKQSISGKNVANIEQHNAVLGEHDQTQQQVDEVEGAINETSAESHKIIGREGDETQEAIEGLQQTTEDIAKRRQDQDLQFRKKDAVIRAQKERDEENRHNSLLDSMNKFKSGSGLTKSNATKSGGGILDTLMKFLPLLLPPLMLILPKLILFGSAIAGAAAGITYFVNTLKNLNLGQFGEGLKGAWGLLTEGTVAPEVERAREATLQQSTMDRADSARVVKKTLSTSESITEEIQKKSEIYKPTPNKEDVTDEGAFKDLDKRKQALDDATQVLQGFKLLLDNSKEDVKTPGGLTGATKVITQFVKENYSTYHVMMERAGFKSKDAAPEGLENYAALFEKINSQIAKAKEDKESGKLKGEDADKPLHEIVHRRVKRDIQTAATQQESAWKSLGMGDLSEKKPVKNVEGEVSSVESSPLAEQPVVMRNTDAEIQSDKSMQSGSSIVNVIAPSGGNGGPPPSPSAPPSEMSPDRVTTNTIPESEILAVAYARQTQYATFPAV